MWAPAMGSSGRLGEAIARRLASDGIGVLGIDIMPSTTMDVVGSVADQALVRDLIAGVDLVYHTAALHKPHVATHRE